MIELITNTGTYIQVYTGTYLHLLLKLHVREKLLNEICAKQLCFVSTVRLEICALYLTELFEF